MEELFIYVVIFGTLFWSGSKDDYWVSGRIVWALTGLDPSVSAWH
jgi:hypothetical protein